MGKRYHMIGGKFNMLTPIKYAGKSNGGARLWECKCDCGGITIQRTVALTKGLVKSCGCGRNSEWLKLPKGEAAFNQLYHNYRIGAKRTGREFKLTKDDFFIITSQNCYYCDAVPHKEHRSSKGCNGAYVFNGIDRVDNSKGYVEGNCVPCCWKCNEWKKNYTEEDFLSHISKIYENMRCWNGA